MFNTYKYGFKLQRGRLCFLGGTNVNSRWTMELTTVWDGGLLQLTCLSGDHIAAIWNALIWDFCYEQNIGFKGINCHSNMSAKNYIKLFLLLISSSFLNIAVLTGTIRHETRGVRKYINPQNLTCQVHLFKGNNSQTIWESGDTQVESRDHKDSALLSG